MEALNENDSHLGRRMIESLSSCRGVYHPPPRMSTPCLDCFVI